MANTPKNSEFSSSSNFTLPKSLVTARNEIKAFVTNNIGYIQLNFFTLFWLFVGASVFGLLVETLYHALLFGGYESRAGLVWGPFSPIYGVGAVVLTLFLNRYYHSHNLIIFLIGMLLGSTIEYCASWGMEVFWGTIAWDYTGTFGSIHGRTNFYFGIMWGLLGLVWVRIILPFVKHVFDKIDSKNTFVRIITIGFSVFMAFNIICTCFALVRQKERAEDIPAQNPIQMFCDDVFPDSFLETRFQNMSLR